MPGFDEPRQSATAAPTTRANEPAAARNPHANERLASLGAVLRAHKFVVELGPRGLKINNPNTPGCCDESRMPADTISCRPRHDDAERLWFFTSWGEPIAEADKISDAAVYVKGYLRAPQ